MTNKFLGAPYPIVSTARGLLATQRGVDQIKADLLQLLLTNPGERVMLPGFGTPLREIIFEPNDATSSEQVRDMIINSIRTWEPRITIEQIDVSTQADQESLHEDDSLEDIGHIMIVRILASEKRDRVEEMEGSTPLSLK